jgi:hypothetical protein
MFSRWSQSTHHPLFVALNNLPHVLDEKGKVRDARRLVSMIFTRPSLAINCMLKGPVISNAMAVHARGEQ